MSKLQEKYQQKENEKLAINGGTPIRESILQYGKQTIDQSDKEAVLSVLDENKYLTTGPEVVKFEEEMATFLNKKYAVAVNSGTAALHCAVNAIQASPGSEIIVTTMSFVASANCVLYCGLKPILCDIDPDTLNIDIDKAEKLITNKTVGIVAVDFAGQLCDHEKLRALCDKYSLYLIEDAAHSVGIEGVGKYADLTTLSFHPVKNMTTCEGGMIVTDNELFYNKMKQFRTHGITTDYKKRENTGSHYYEMVELGFNYRIPDLLCALGRSQLKRLSEFVKRRNEIAQQYDHAFESLKQIKPLKQLFPSAYHIYVIKLDLNKLSATRDQIFKALKAEGIGVNVHYMPIHMHPYYISKYNKQSLLVSESVYQQIITLPLFPTMTDRDIEDVIKGVKKVVKFYLFIKGLKSHIFLFE